MADIFISYARKDRGVAQRVASALEAEGHSVWWDLDIRGGENFDEAIERELDLASVVIVLWSQQSASSNWVRSEAAAAAERGVLVPAFIESVKLPLEFRRRQTIDLTSWVGDASAYEFGLIRQAIATHLPPTTHSPSSSTGRPSAAPGDRNATLPSTPLDPWRARVRDVLGIGILLLVLASVVYFGSAMLRRGRGAGEEVPKVASSSPITDRTNEPVDLLVNGSFEQISAHGFPYRWDLREWRSIGEGGIDTAVAYSGLRSARASSVIPGHVRWAQAVDVDRDATYVLTAMIKTAEVIHAENDDYVLGANLGVLGLTDHGEEIIKYSAPVLGNSEWRKETVRFETGSNEKIMIVLELGGYSAIARGAVWFDDVHLEPETASSHK